MNIETIAKGLQEAIATRRASLEAGKAELAGLEASLKALQRSGDAKVRVIGGANAVSVRQGILLVLKDNTDKALQPKQIAEMLKDKGYATASDSLQTNVGATLSVMLNARKEVKRGPDKQGYLISAKGIATLSASAEAAS